jgi:hypothetical protein
MSQYNFTKDPCSLDRLTQEIQQSAIITALDHCSLSGSDLLVVFKADLSETDTTLLNSVVTAHNGEPLAQNALTNVKLVEDDTTPRDSDGSPLQRTKVTTTGWHYQLHGIEFETSKLNSLESKKADGSDWNFAILKFYELVNGVETQITGENLTQEYLDTHCIKTVVDWEPTFDVDIIGGMLRQAAPPTESVDLWVVGAPDISAAYGGSKEFVTNLDLELMGEGVQIDGKAPKYVPYNATYHTGKFRLILRHPAGFKHELHMVFEIFKA